MPKILIVDDYTRDRISLLEYFETKGWEATAASSGEDALRLVNSSFHVVLLDWRLALGDVSGWYVLSELRAREDLKQLAVVIYSEYLSDDAVREVKAHGADDYFLKAAPLETLEEKLLPVVKRRNPGLAAGQPKLRVFLCHASQDKQLVRKLSRRLRQDGHSPWLDEEQLVGGQDWDLEIKRAVRSSDIVVVCLSQTAVGKTGYLQKELRQALDIADEQPEGSIFIIPVKFNSCDVPDRLRRWQWIDLRERGGYRETPQISQQHTAYKTPNNRAVIRSLSFSIVPYPLWDIPKNIAFWENPLDGYDKEARGPVRPRIDKGQTPRHGEPACTASAILRVARLVRGARVR